MRCETCQGTGLMLSIEGHLYPGQEPCVTCQGSGIAHCCEGERPDEGWGGGNALAQAIFTAACLLMLALPLAGCVTSKSSSVTISPRIDSPRLPPMPARIRGCFGQLTTIPVKNLSGSELTRVLARVRTSEARRTRCGRDALQWYDGLRRSNSK